MKKTTITHFKNLDELSIAASRLLIEVAASSIKKRNSFSLVLAGGNTPRKLYQLLASPENAMSIDWQKTFIFWGDERCVEPNSPDSNFLMVKETMLKDNLIPPDNVFRIQGELEPEESAIRYETNLRRLVDKGVLTKNASSNIPIFDLVLLGMGDDGHTASIFPSSPLLEENKRLICSTPVPKANPQVKRVTMTLPLLNESKNVWFMAAGARKKEIVAEITEDKKKYPAGRINPAGYLRWFIAD